MRVDNSNLIEITKSNNSVEVKGNVTVTTQQTTTQQVDQETGRVSSVKQTTVDKPFFSGEADSEIEKIQQEAENKELKLYQDKIATVVNTATPRDCAKMEEDGYHLNSTEVKTIVTEMDKIKIELAKAGADISVYGDELSSAQLEEAAGNAQLARQMENLMEQAELPATEDNVTDAVETVKQAQSLTECKEGTVKYMLDNELKPTVGNLYKAQHSTNDAPESEQKPQQKPMDSNLQKQVEQVISQTDMQVNDTTLDYSQWMLENEIPLTKENLQYVADLNQMKFPVDAQKLEKAMVEAVAEGKRPKDAVILDGYSLTDQAQHAQEVVNQATDSNIWTVLDKGLPVTIENLEAAMNQEQPSAAAKEDLSQDIPEFVKEDIKYITAKRQLEEIRLMMTTQANYTLLKQGISIDTRPLEELVEQLKGAEQNYYTNMLKDNGVEATSENAALFADTVGKTEVLKSVPSYILGITNTQNDTIDVMHKTGTALKAKLDRAGASYETLMTFPRADMGDSIQKAFQNVDDILVDLGLETSESNQRAVRILAYNQSEITPDSIAGMKAADQKVQVLFQNLSPSVVMEMIRKGVNPMEMDISRLNSIAEEIKKETDPGEEEKFSKYLWKLEQKHDISPNERDSYIGIYRLLNQIDKTNGAVIGSLVNQGADLSMKNLLTAVRTNRNPGINVSVDDSFGETDTVNTQELSISQQIEASYQTDCAKQAFGILTPEGVEQAVAQGTMAQVTPEQLLWQLKNTKAEKNSEEEYYQQQLKDFSSAKDAEASVLKMLTGSDMPVTAYNVLAASQMLHNRSGIFKSLFEGEPAGDTDLEQAKEEILEDFAEAVKTPEEMAKAQKKLADIAEKVMDTMAKTNQIQSIDVRDIKIMRQQIELGTKMAREENYTIPVLVGDEITGVHLKIVRGSQKRGRVDVILDSPKAGKLAAKFQVQGQKVKGYIVADSEEKAQVLKKDIEALNEKMSMEGSLYPNLEVIQSDNLDLDRFMADDRKYGSMPGQSEEEYEIQTKTLYGIAKTFLEAVKQLGNEKEQIA